jgi:hypothetical protein
MLCCWEFDISTSPTSQAIPPCDPDSQDDELDSVLPRIKLHQPTDCNCFNLPINPVCPDIHTHQMMEEAPSGSIVVENEMEGIQHYHNTIYKCIDYCVMRCKDLY